MTRTKRQKRLARQAKARRGHCPCPSKRAYPTHGEARAALSTQLRVAASGKRATRVYKFKCGAWHLTSRGPYAG